MVVILRVSSGAKEKGITAGIAVGAVIGLEAMFAGPVSGASMNQPAPSPLLLSLPISSIFGFTWLHPSWALSSLFFWSGL